ncbi:MAG: hypothetical protein JSS25_00165 [Proteobacteria bacterium]|nr:hypothetical protein [Pseudomonadota bacterium]
MSKTDNERSAISNREVGTGTITTIYRAKVTQGEKIIELGEFDSEEEAEQAIIMAEADWEQELTDASFPSKTRRCYNCEGTGKIQNEECNMCAGTGRVPE